MKATKGARATGGGVRAARSLSSRKLLLHSAVNIEFDPDKDRTNIAKHGVSLARAIDFDIRSVEEDHRRDYGERRYRAFGLIDGTPHCLAFAVRGSALRAISLRRAHLEEFESHVAHR